MGSNSEILPPLENGDDFESLCYDLWKDIWQDDGARKHGRKGQAQAGVDVYGQNSGRWIGVQCKQVSQTAGSPLEPDDLSAEVAKAPKFQPPLSAFILATTGPADALQTRSLSLERFVKYRGRMTEHELEETVQALAAIVEFS